MNNFIYHFIKGHILFILAGLCLLSSLSLAFTPAVAATSTPEIIKAEKYMQSMGTVKARFLQTTSSGPQLTGTFYLHRPGRLRFEYDPPLKDYIVADGTFIYFYDGDINEQRNALIGQTLADFILRPNISLTDEYINVERIMHVEDMLQITLLQTDDPHSGSITLGFEKEPFQLKKWRVVDAMGEITEIELFDIQTDMPLPRSLFTFIAPKTKGFNQ